MLTFLLKLLASQKLRVHCDHASSRMVSRAASEPRHHRPLASDESGLAHHDGITTTLSIDALSVPISTPINT